MGIMDKLNNVVRFEVESGETIDMVILKEFDYKDKKYAVLMGMDGCDCDDDCECGCHEGKECTCDDCECDESICIVEKVTDKDGSDVFKPIEDDKFYEELVNEADKLLFEEK
jgi:hypothetical protein